MCVFDRMLDVVFKYIKPFQYSLFGSCLVCRWSQYKDLEEPRGPQRLGGSSAQ